MAELLTLEVGDWSFTARAWGPSGGRVVLLLHGFPQTSTSWAAVGAQLGQRGLRAVAVDQRGYSSGARPSDVAAYRMADLVRDAMGFAQSLGGRVDVAGHDFGGIVGWQLATRHPELVRTFIAVSTPNQLALDHVLATVPEERERFAYIREFRRPGVAEAALLDDDGRRLRALFGDRMPSARMDEDVAAMQLPGALTAALNWYRAMSPDDSQGLGLVTVPTSYVWGSADIAFGRAAAELSGRYVDADYRFVPLEGASHWLPDERPELLADEICLRALG
ncbi:MAG: alpha/beta hydrolase [Actinomycetota bacterium]